MARVLIKRLLLLLGLIFCAMGATKAHAVNCALTSGANQSTIQSALNAAGSGTCTGTSASTAVAFAAGTFGTIGSTVTIPCGVTLITGPVVPYSQTHNQTAVINGSGGQSGPGFNHSNCSTAITIQYLEWNGNRSSATDGNSGGFITLQGNTSNVTIQNNYLHGVSGCNNDSSHGCGNVGSNLINIGGGGGGSTTTNTVIQLNEFGAEFLQDCAAAMNDTQTAVGGGNCSGVGVYGNTANVSVIRNIAHYLEQGFKYYEVSSYGNAFCNPFTLSYNSITQVNRISYETQCNIGTSSFPTLMYVQYNYIGNRCSQSGCTNDTLFDLSDANGCGPGAGSFCVTHTDYNVDVQNLSSNHGAGFEIWGQQGTTGSYNLIQGYPTNGGCSAFCWDTNGAFTFANNTISVFSGRYFQNGGNPAAFTPTITGNTTNTTPAEITSVQPSISPAGGSFSGSQVVTFNCGGCTNRDTNTGVWYTTDGSTPVPGAGTAKYVTQGGNFTLTTSATVKAVGMWGSINQPYSYPSGMGYVPSAVVSAAFSGGGTPTVSTPTFTPGTETFWPSPLSVSAATGTPGATLHCTTDGTTPTTSSPVYSGPFSVTTTTTIQCIGVLSGFVNSGVGSGTYTATPPALTGCYQHNTSANVNSLAVGGTIQQFVFCQYTGLPDQQCSPAADTNLSVVTSWGLTGGTNVSVGAVGSGTSGLVTGVTAGTGTLTTVTVAQNGVPGPTCGEWGWTVTNSPPTLTGVSISLTGGGSAVTIGSPLQACATFLYTGSISDTICGNSPDAFGSSANTWVSSVPGNATISSSGLVSGVATGTTNISVKATNGSTTVGPSTPQTISINPAVHGSNVILSGPQHLQGAVLQ